MAYFIHQPNDRTPEPSGRARAWFYGGLAALIFIGPKVHDWLYR